MSTAIDLRSVLENAGITPTRESKKEIAAHCPRHVERTGHHDVHPSWSINKYSYIHFCFSCGYRGTITSLLVDLTGSAPEDLEGTLNRESFLRKMAPVREDPEQYIGPILTEWALRNRLTDVPQRLLAFRKLRREAVDAMEVRWSSETKQWVLPLRDESGTLMGAQYRQKGVVLTLPEGMPKSVLLFGFLQMRDKDHVTLVESPLDAVRLFGLGIPAVSSLGAWVSRDQVRLLARNFARVFVGLDNDKAGNDACGIVFPMLRKAGCVPIRWRYEGLLDDDGEPAKDIGDVASDDAVRDSWRRTWRFGM